MSRQYLHTWLTSASGFFTEALPCAELSAHSVLSRPQSMQIEPGLSWEGPDSIWIYWFHQLRVPYMVWSPTGIHWLNPRDSACAAKAKNRGGKRMENLLGHEGNFFLVLLITVQRSYWLATLSGWCTLVYKISYTICPFLILVFPRDGHQTGQGSSMNSNLPKFSGWNEDTRLPKHKAKPYEELHCCRVGFKATSDWEMGIICVCRCTYLQNSHFCDVSNILVLSTPERVSAPVCNSTRGQAEQKAAGMSVSQQERLQPSCIISLAPSTL